MSSKSNTAVVVVDNRSKFVGDKCGWCRACYQEHVRLNTFFYERMECRLALEAERGIIESQTDYELEVLGPDDDLPF